MSIESLRLGEDSLAVRAAWLHYAGGLTQASVARRLGVSGVKAHRLIARAAQAGVVKITIDGEIAECAALEEQLSAAHELSYCEVVPDLEEDGLPLRALGPAGAAYLRREIEAGASPVIGMGHGRTLAAALDCLPRVRAGAVRFVSLLGGLTRSFAANPHDVMHRLARRTGGEAFFMPVPFLANTRADRDVLLAQHGVRDVFALAGRSGLKVVGIGTARADASLVGAGMIGRREIADVEAAGGVGEMLGHFFDADGHPVETGLTGRTISVGLDALEGTRVVALAGGPGKAEAIRSVLAGGRLDGLITDERTATALVRPEPG